MFDIGFSEVLLILIIGLVVLGPTRLPIAIRTVMGWVNTMRKMATNVQNELSQELKLQELQASIKKAEQLSMEKLSPELAQSVKELRASAQKMQAELQKSVQETEQHSNHVEKAESSPDTTQAESPVAPIKADIPEQPEETDEYTVPSHWVIEPFNPNPTLMMPTMPNSPEPVSSAHLNKEEESTAENTVKPAIEINSDYFTSDDLACGEEAVFPISTQNKRNDDNTK